MANFQPASIVRLKSGGPVMTVTNTDDPESIGVTWFDAKLEPRYGAYPEAALQIAQTGGTPGVHAV
jgi:uncharacterized protein YodC (DUF2158 family)